MNIDLLTVESTRTAICEKQFTASAVVDAFYEKIRKDDPDIGAYLTLSEERAYAQAARIDELAGTRRRAAAAGGRADRRERRHQHQGRAHHRRLEDSRQLRRSVRRDGG